LDAEQVCSGGVLRSERVVEVVGRLVDKSILTMAHGGRQTRYQLLETLRLYGAERLAEAGEVGDVQQRDLQWCEALLSGGDPVWWPGPVRQTCAPVIDTEWLDLRAALEQWNDPGGDAEVGLRMPADMWMYWNAPKGAAPKKSIHES
jgi:predicted ATPase